LSQEIFALSRHSRALPRAMSLFVLCFTLVVSQASRAASPAPEFPTEAQLAEDDREALRVLFERLGDAFTKGDAIAGTELILPEQEKVRILDTLKKEFKEVRYVEFHIENILPDTQLAKHRYSVDVILRLKIAFISDARNDTKSPVENRTFHTFIVQRTNHNVFKIINSDFFANMGKRSGGVRLYVDLTIYAIAGLGALMIWLWGAVDALSLRPRNRLWQRIAIFIPVLGAIAFFIARPKLKRRK
jgi:hypothetical protein